MKYVLLTGASGLLGQYILRDLQASGRPVACLVRDSVGYPAALRVDRNLKRWERATGVAERRPVVLTGDICRPNLGLDDDSLAWIAEHCDSVIHSAACLEFYAKGPEPRRSNVDGTRELLATARRIGLQHWHHISTAYVCGTRTDVVHEMPPEPNTEYGNDYELSKADAERLVQEADFLRTKTIYRPSIIVGDSRDSYTSTFVTFYTFVRVVAAIAAEQGLAGLDRDVYFKALGLRGNERKNLVHVDWVASVVAECVRRPETHGRIYQLTNPHPVTVSDVTEAINAAIAARYRAGKSSPSATNSIAALAAPPSFDDEAHPLTHYRAYFRDEPDFDTTNTRAAVPHLPCPRIDRAAMERLSDFAVASNFGWPKPAREPAHFDAEAHLSSYLQRTMQRPPVVGSREAQRFETVTLEASGSGGGAWNVQLRDGAPTAFRPGLADAPRSLYLNTHTWADLVAGRLTCEEAAYAGRLVLTGPHQTERELIDLAARLLLAPTRNGFASNGHPDSVHSAAPGVGS